MKRIETFRNPRIRLLLQIKVRNPEDRSGLYLVCGTEAIAKEKEAGTVEFYIADHEMEDGTEHDILTVGKILWRLSGGDPSVHEIAICRRKDLIRHERILLLDGVNDYGNIGTLIRTAVSFCFDAIYYQNDFKDLYSEKTVQAAKGSFLKIPVIEADLTKLIPSLKQEDVHVVATRLEESRTFEEIPSYEKMAFVLGNEVKGVRKEVQDLADECLRIDMDGFESLNVGVAGGIVMHWYHKR